MTKRTNGHDDLLEFTREEWSDRPFLIELRGGYYDGRRFDWPTLPPMWSQPEPVSLSPLEWAAVLKMSPSRPDYRSLAPIANYRKTDHVTDDGAHIYEYSGHE